MASISLTILSATIASFIFGWIWYGPLFGKTWARENKIKGTEEFQAKKLFYHFLTAILLVSALYLLIGSDFSIGFIAALIIWLGFFVSTRLSSMIWMKQSWVVFNIDIVYHLLNLILITWVLSVI